LCFLDSERDLSGSIRSSSVVSDRLPSGLTSPVRTPLTEGDPLGALGVNEDDVDNELTITNLVDANNLLNKKHLYEMSMSTPEKPKADETPSDGRKRSRFESESSRIELFGAGFAEKEARARRLSPAQVKN